MWCEQALALAESKEFIEHFITKDSAHTKYTDPTLDTDAKNFIQTLKENFAAWRKSDHLLRGRIICTLSKEALGFVVGLDTTCSM